MSSEAACRRGLRKETRLESNICCEEVIHLSDVNRVLEGDIPEEVEKTFQSVVILGCSIFSSSPDDIVCLDLKES